METKYFKVLKKYFETILCKRKIRKKYFAKIGMKFKALRKLRFHLGSLLFNYKNWSPLLEALGSLYDKPYD